MEPFGGEDLRVSVRSVGTVTWIKADGQQTDFTEAGKSALRVENIDGGP